MLLTPLGREAKNLRRGLVWEVTRLSPPPRYLVPVRTRGIIRVGDNSTKNMYQKLEPVASTMRTIDLLKREKQKITHAHSFLALPETTLWGRLFHTPSVSTLFAQTFRRLRCPLSPPARGLALRRLFMDQITHRCPGKKTSLVSSPLLHSTPRPRRRPRAQTTPPWNSPRASCQLRRASHSRSSVRSPCSRLSPRS